MCARNRKNYTDWDQNIEIQIELTAYAIHTTPFNPIIGLCTCLRVEHFFYFILFHFVCVCLLFILTSYSLFHLIRISSHVKWKFAIEIIISKEWRGCWPYYMSLCVMLCKLVYCFCCFYYNLTQFSCVALCRYLSIWTYLTLLLFSSSGIKHIFK